ncbi:MAG: hypothetical protein WDZ83_05195 [Rhizobiaceae bacterium]
MKSSAGRARRAFVLSFAGATALVAAGCTGGGGSSRPQIPSNQPRIATYQCGEDGEIRIVNTGAAVLISENLVVAVEDDEQDSEQDAEPAERRFELVAAPPSQRSRYGAEGLALVLEGREALWMKAGSAPLTCNR